METDRINIKKLVEKKEFGLEPIFSHGIYFVRHCEIKTRAVEG